MTDEQDKGEKCVRCGEVGEDRRTLRMACFYAMEELAVPFEKQQLFWADINPSKMTLKDPAFQFETGSPSLPKITLAPPVFNYEGELTPETLYTLRVCKDCRSDWLKAIEDWFKAGPQTPPDDGQVRNIPIRERGTTRMISREEWDERERRREKP